MKSSNISSYVNEVQIDDNYHHQVIYFDKSIFIPTLLKLDTILDVINFESQEE